jgi:leader peptidase (prepilin peptidase)/N-methyltransferase
LSSGLSLRFFLPLSWYDSLLGILAGGGIILVVGYVGKWVFKKEAMGDGDVKLMAMIGAFLGGNSCC